MSDLQVCLDLVRLLHFLSQSPLGSVGLLDFQPRQFVTVSGQLKLTDLDDISAEETACRTDADCTLQFLHRNFTLPCSSRGVCEDLNEKRNIYNAYRPLSRFIQEQFWSPGAQWSLRGVREEEQSSPTAVIVTCWINVEITVELELTELKPLCEHADRSSALLHMERPVEAV
ncbi:hypothetical protein XENOCAPTIV_009245 [Xenoophorus captivus]|uniref:Uncharacterized protein n=1 Tax=Xenoophorus captivus TaxID=1517983 RepID=A0ABV0R0Z5_9TELE